jgi:hypothetical protein
MEENLTVEQEYLLRAIALEAQGLSREELFNALLNCWEARFRQKQIFLATCRSAGFAFKLDEGATIFTPDKIEDLEQIFGYVPTAEEANDYMKSMVETATMELDMDEIVLESEE